MRKRIKFSSFSFLIIDRYIASDGRKKEAAWAGRKIRIDVHCSVEHDAWRIIATDIHVVCGE